MDPERALEALRQAGAREVRTWSRRRFGFVVERDYALVWLGQTPAEAAGNLKALNLPPAEYDPPPAREPRTKAEASRARDREVEADFGALLRTVQVEQAASLRGRGG